MKTLRPVSTQRVRSATGIRSLGLAEVSDGLWSASLGTYILTCDLKTPSVLHVKGQSFRRFSGTRSLRSLMNYVDSSNRNRISPKAYLEEIGTPGRYTVSAEVNRIVASGLSETQFSAFCETATLSLTAFFEALETTINQAKSSGRQNVDGLAQDPGVEKSLSSVTELTVHRGDQSD